MTGFSVSVLLAADEEALARSGAYTSSVRQSSDVDVGHAAAGF